MPCNYLEKCIYSIISEAKCYWLSKTSQKGISKNQGQVCVIPEVHQLYLTGRNFVLFPTVQSAHIPHLASPARIFSYRFDFYLLSLGSHSISLNFLFELLIVLHNHISDCSYDHLMDIEQAVPKITALQNLRKQLEEIIEAGKIQCLFFSQNLEIKLFSWTLKRGQKTLFPGEFPLSTGRDYHPATS